MRRNVRREIGRSSTQHLTIFTDAAHSVLVWTWTARHGDEPPAYRELSFLPGQAWGPLRPVLASVAAGCEGPDDQEISVTDAGGRALRALVREVAGRSPGVANTELAGMVQAEIEGCEDADALRTWWRAALGLRILDADCGTGEWLADARRALVPVYGACLERMGSFVEDVDRRRPRPRRVLVGDFRRLVERSGGSRATSKRRSFCEELALLHNLAGAAADAETAAECRRLLTAGPPDGLTAVAPPSVLETSVRIGRVASSGSENSRDRPSGEHQEQIDIACRAMNALRRLHLLEGVGLSELAPGYSLVAKRLDWINAETAPGSRDSLNPFIEFEGGLAQSRFQIVRGVSPEC
jgi:hypothetical protein